MMGEGEDDSGSLDSDSDLILDGENATGVGPGKFILNLKFVMDKENQKGFMIQVNYYSSPSNKCAALFILF